MPLLVGGCIAGAIPLSSTQVQPTVVVQRKSAQPCLARLLSQPDVTFPVSSSADFGWESLQGITALLGESWESLGRVATTPAPPWESMGLIQAPKIPAWESLHGMLTGNVTNDQRLSEDASSGDFFGSGVTITVDQARTPDGAVTADLVTISALGGQHRLQLRAVVAASDYAPQTVSAYVKLPASNAQVHWGFQFRDKTNTLYSVVWNLTTGAMTLLEGSGLIVPWTPVFLGDGWVRIAATIRNIGTGATTYQPRLIMASSDGVTLAYAGDGLSGGYVWGSQLQTNVGAVGRYIATGAAAVSGPNLLGAGWESLGRVATPASPAWESQGRIAVALLAPWESRGAILSARSTAWESRLGVALASVLGWESRGRVALLASPGWESLGAILSGRTLGWESLGGVTQAKVLGWESRGYISGLRVIGWESLSPVAFVTASAVISWESLGRITSLRSPAYESLLGLRSVRATEWESLTGIQVVRVIPWESWVAFIAVSFIRLVNVQLHVPALSNLRLTVPQLTDVALTLPGDDFALATGGLDEIGLSVPDLAGTKVIV